MVSKVVLAAVLAACLGAVGTTGDDAAVAAASEVNCVADGAGRAFVVKKGGPQLPARLAGGHCTKITGNLKITCSSDSITPEDQRIYNLTFLSKVRSIEGYLQIIGCDHLESLSGLEMLTTIEGARASEGIPSLEIRACKRLKNLKALEGLEKITQGEPSVRIVEGNDKLCYQDQMPWSEIVTNSEDLSAGGLALDKDKVDVFVQSATCLDDEFVCDPSTCFCGYCGGPGLCLNQEQCKEIDWDTPEWVLRSHANKTAYAFIIIFASVGSVLAFATLFGCILGKVKMQVLITFQKPPKKIRPALRPTPFGAQNPGITQWQPGLQQQQDLPSVDAPSTAGSMRTDGGDQGQGQSRDVSRLRPQSTGGNSVVSLPRLNTDQEALTRGNSAASQLEGGGGGDAQADAMVATAPQKKMSMEAAAVIDQARNRFVTPGQVEKIDDPNDAEPEADMICPTDDCGKVAEFVCSRCSKQGYCSSSCQRTHWKSHRADCKRWTKEARAKRVSVAKRRSSLGQLGAGGSGSAGSRNPTPLRGSIAEKPKAAAPEPEAGTEAEPAKVPEPPKPAEASDPAPAAPTLAAETAPVPPIPAAAATAAVESAAAEPEPVAAPVESAAPAESAAADPEPAAPESEAAAAEPAAPESEAAAAEPAAPESKAAAEAPAATVEPEAASAAAAEAPAAAAEAPAAAAEVPAAAAEAPAEESAPADG